jgi:hypothetical protein
MESTIEEDVILDEGYTQSELEEEIGNEEAWERVAEEAQERFESLVAEAIAFANKYITHVQGGRPVRCTIVGGKRRALCC